MRNGYTEPLDHIAVISPVFIITLLAGVSAPMIEKQADKRWGDNSHYLEYKEKTPYLIGIPSFKKIKETK